MEREARRLERIIFQGKMELFRIHLDASYGRLLLDTSQGIRKCSDSGAYGYSLFNKLLTQQTMCKLPIIMNAGAITSAMELARTMMSGGISSGASEISDAAASGVDVAYFIELFKNLAMPDKLLDYIVAAVARINDIISASGVQIIIFIAALQSIPGSMYEVAKIEGATAYETFWKVTFPMVMPHIITNVVYTVVDNFAQSDVVQLAYDTCFNEINYGLSSTMSFVSTVIVCVILVLVCGFIQKRTFYYN